MIWFTPQAWYGMAVIMPLALLLDWILGDPPNRFHPTAWMGGLIALAIRFRPWGSPAREFAYGALLTLGGMALVSTLGLGLSRVASQLPLWAGILLQAMVLKLAISMRGLWRASGTVHAALREGNLPEARRLLSWHLVSRDTAGLDPARVAAATVESVAENASDGTIAPLFFFALGGLPLALAYRFLNTVDSMLGYRDADHEWIGKSAARLDDVFNFLPARLAALCMVGASMIHKRSSGVAAWRVLRRDARLTASPNAGHPMSAMAGALGVELEKTGVYRLGAGCRLPEERDILHARGLMVASVLVSALALSLATIL